MNHKDTLDLPHTKTPKVYNVHLKVNGNSNVGGRVSDVCFYYYACFNAPVITGYVRLSNSARVEDEICFLNFSTCEEETMQYFAPDNTGAGDPNVGGSPSSGGSVSNDPNAFYNLSNPVDAPDEAIINNGIEIGEVSNTSPTNSRRKIGYTSDKGDTEDITFGIDGNTTDIDPQSLVGAPDDVLFTNMDLLFSACTVFDGDLRNVGKTMIQRFQNKTGGQFEDPVLNQKVSESNKMTNFLKRFGNALQNNLQNVGGNIDIVAPVNMQTDRPIFNGLHNLFHGLMILMEDTEYTEIQLDNFDSNYAPGQWKAEVTVTIHDHFGLDKNDVLSNQYYHQGFAAWWLLQHTKGYTPFERIVHVRKSIIGHF